MTGGAREAAIHGAVDAEVGGGGVADDLGDGVVAAVAAGGGAAGGLVVRVRPEGSRSFVQPFVPTYVRVPATRQCGCHEKPFMGARNSRPSRAPPPPSRYELLERLVVAAERLVVAEAARADAEAGRADAATKRARLAEERYDAERMRHVTDMAKYQM